jgi:hypothetical protein
MYNNLILLLSELLQNSVFSENRSLEKGVDDVVELSLSSCHGEAELRLRNPSVNVLNNVTVERDGESNLVWYGDRKKKVGDIQPYASENIEAVLLDQGPKKTLFKVSWEDEDGKVHSLMRYVNS